jgi:hypothetical protein
MVWYLVKHRENFTFTFRKCFSCDFISSPDDRKVVSINAVYSRRNVILDLWQYDTVRFVLEFGNFKGPVQEMQMPVSILEKFCPEFDAMRWIHQAIIKPRRRGGRTFLILPKDLIYDHLPSAFQSCLLLWGFPPNILYAFLMYSKHATCPAHLILVFMRSI